jgi:flagellar biosynthesis GTPase FlhF
MPLSYFSLGQLIPEDLEAANKERVTESLVSKLPANLQAVA